MLQVSPEKMPVGARDRAGRGVGAVQAVTHHANVVGRGVPDERNARRGARARHDARWCRGEPACRGRRAWSRSPRRDWSVALRVQGVDLEHVSAATAETRDRRWQAASSSTGTYRRGSCGSPPPRRCRWRGSRTERRSSWWRRRLREPWASMAPACRSGASSSSRRWWRW